MLARIETTHERVDQDLGGEQRAGDERDRGTGQAGQGRGQKEKQWVEAQEVAVADRPPPPE
jgi:hypothetical protein